ncbi:MAG: lysophospholipase [Rhodospirillaceae bacterium]|nr:lysophospholipase [Rhodospirillaceae bacterium]|tara:strand:+ start:2542 stop:2979 length:438 start_codon:yes stop_codon:yes gene_type:complete
MALNLIKLAVGVDSISHLQQRQENRLLEYKDTGRKMHRVLTRNMPKRAEEIIKGGGSLYWVIKGHVLVRQMISTIEIIENNNDKRRCAIYLEPKLVGVISRRIRPFQGWRYFEHANTPPDLPEAFCAENDMESELAVELRELGLI